MKKVIVLVDDNPTTIFYNKDVVMDFSSADSEIITYQDSELFLNDFLEEKFNDFDEILVLLDINMPEYNGYEVLEEIEEEVEDLDKLKVVMLTSSRLKSDFEKSGRFSPIVGYIEKPLTEVKLTTCLQN